MHSHSGCPPRQSSSPRPPGRPPHHRSGSGYSGHYNGSLWPGRCPGDMEGRWSRHSALCSGPSGSALWNRMGSDSQKGCPALPSWLPTSLSAHPAQSVFLSLLPLPLQPLTHWTAPAARWAIPPLNVTSTVTPGARSAALTPDAQQQQKQECLGDRDADPSPGRPPLLRLRGRRGAHGWGRPSSSSWCTAQEGPLRSPHACPPPTWQELTLPAF